MGDLISEKLISSCEELFSKNVINEEQYIKCKTNIDDGGKYLMMNLNEKKIFRVDRNNREKKYKDFIEEVEQLVDNIFTVINNSTVEADDGAKTIEQTEYDILTILNLVIIDIIESVNKKSVDRYKNKEKSQYMKLLKFYNSIDNNRKEIDNIDKKYDTMDKMKDIRDDKLNKILNNTQSKYISFYVLLSINIVLLLVLFLIIKFK
jgi:hypothetical protein